MKRFLTFVLCGGMMFAASKATFPDPPATQPAEGKKGDQTAVFAGGCFWGVEAVFERLKGVSRAVAGYAGGSANTAQYEVVSTGKTGHAESVQVTYDPSQISYGQLLKVFFAVAHDPTTKNRQGPDWGPQYRSAVFYANAEQKRTAEEYIKALDDSKVFHKPVVTEVAPLTKFYAAEEHHQKFVDRNPNYPYVVVNDLPKLDHLRKQFPDMLVKK